jgi:hypothetical protein
MQVLDTINPAIETTKRRLSPFDATTWFSFGLIFFLQSCIEGGGSGGGFQGISRLGRLGGTGSPTPTASGKPWSGANPAFDPEHLLGEWSKVSLTLLVFVALLFLIVVGLAIAIGSVGQSLGIRAVCSERVEISMTDSVKKTAMRLIKFHALSAFLTTLVMVPFLWAGALQLMAMLRDFGNEGAPGFGSRQTAHIVPLVLLAIGATVTLAPLGFVGAMVRNFVAPLSQKFDCTLWQAYQRLRHAPNFSWVSIVGAFCLRFLYAMIAGFAAVIATFCTCCIGALPVLHQALMAPYYVFERAHTLHMLASLGPEYMMLEDEGSDMPYGPGGFAPQTP